MIENLFKKLNEYMNCGNFDNALNLVNNISNLPLPTLYMDFYQGSSYIDIGSSTQNKKLVSKGLKLLKNIESICDKKIKAEVYYNIGNAYSSLFDIERLKNEKKAIGRNTNLSKAINYFRIALDLCHPDKLDFKVRILVNIGNSFDHIGRVVEAIEYFEQALRINPNHFNALISKGQALFYYAGLVDEHHATFLCESYQQFKKALNNSNGDIQLEHLCESSIQKIQDIFIDKSVLDSEKNFPGISLKNLKKFEKTHAEFCIQNKLYLNLCSFCQKCDAALGDKIVIPNMISKVSNVKAALLNKINEPFLMLTSFLNQIKEDFISARLQHCLASSAEVSFDFIFANAAIINTFDYSIHNSETQMLKSSIKQYFSILDKVSFLINEYLDLQISTEKISFNYLFTNTEAITKILATNDYNLNAMYSIHWDLFNGPYTFITGIRHSLTHKFLNVVLIENNPILKDEITLDSLYEVTMILAKIVRSVIIYLIFFMTIEEKKKLKNIPKDTTIVSLPVFEVHH